MAADVDLKKGSPTYGVSTSFTGFGLLMSILVDCVANPMTATYKALLAYIPAGTFIHHTEIVVETPEGDTLTVDLGDWTNADTPVAVNADGWQDGDDGNAAAGTRVTSHASSSAYDATYGKHYATAAQLALLFNNNASTAKLRVNVFGWAPRPNV